MSFYYFTAVMEDKAANGSVDTKRYHLHWFSFVIERFQGMCWTTVIVCCSCPLWWIIFLLTPQPSREWSDARPCQLGGHRCRQLLQSNRVWGASHSFSRSGRPALQLQNPINQKSCKIISCISQTFPSPPDRKSTASHCSWWRVTTSWRGCR